MTTPIDRPRTIIVRQEPRQSKVRNAPALPPHLIHDLRLGNARPSGTDKEVQHHLSLIRSDLMKLPAYQNI